MKFRLKPLHKMKMSDKAVRVVVLLLLFSLGIFAEELIVTLKHGGEIRGSTLKSQKGKTIYAFRGIPYAEPPTGELRFKAPVAKSSWKGQPLDCTNDGPTCLQDDLITSNGIIGQEDCLYLNVYTTKHADDYRNGSKMAVMVFIHGGAFVTGSGSSVNYGPGLLLDEQVILVTMNYRLGAFGFLSTGDKAAPGNYGLMDQSLALKWVNDNIEVFGGDVDRITLFGESAGAASVGYHMLSPMSEGLFRRAIAQSGTPLSSWALQRNPLYWAKKLGAYFDCSAPSISEMVECLKEIPAIDIIQMVAGSESPEWRFADFFPTIDGSFLRKEPMEMLTSGMVNNVSYLSGVNKDEGLLTYAMLFKNYNTSTRSEAIKRTIKEMFDDEIGNLVMKKYFSQVNWDDEEAVRIAAVKVFSDSSLTKTHYQMMKELAQNGLSIYAYELDYAPSISFLRLFGVTENWGVSHADDLGFLFDGPGWILQNYTSDDLKIMRVMCPAWANFAKYGNPTPNVNQDNPLQWKLSNSNAMLVYHIDNPVKTVKYEPDGDDLYHFWTEVVPSLQSKKP